MDMARARTSCISPATLVAVSLLVSAGALAEAAGAGALVVGPTSRRLDRAGSEREQVAQLLACLTQAAKELHGRGADRNLDHNDAATHGSFDLVLELPGVCLGLTDQRNDRLPAATPWPAHLIDLPPPGASCA